MATSRLDEVLRLCAEEFRASGYLVPAKGRIFRELAADHLLWVGLPNFGAGSVVELRPNVGVHHVGVMKLFASLRERSYTKGRFATYAVSLESLRSTCARFVFDGRDNPREAERMVQMISAFAVPWADSVSELDHLIELMRTRQDGLGGVPEQIAIALLLAERAGELVAYLDERQKAYDCDPANPEIAKRWMEFSSKLRSLVESSGQGAVP